MKIRWLPITTLVLLLGPLPREAHGGWPILHWMEAPPSNGVAPAGRASDQAEFRRIAAFDPHRDGDRTWRALKETLKEGDVIAYREAAWKTQLEILLLGKLNKLPYALFEYGHMAMVVKDADDESRFRLLSSWSLRGPNIGDDLDSLRKYRWDAYRLSHWDQVNKPRLYEFIRIVREKAENWYGYDFSGMFGLWNSNLRPRTPDDIGRDYICSTVIVAALAYAGVELDAYHRYGIVDIVTPLQVVSSKGRMVSLASSNVTFTEDPPLVIVADDDEAAGLDTTNPGEEG
ncbi:MAG TPA: hypothetical protein VNL14_17070 [Candidatus Acidoferrales bacterium]|nr:hypothetical protein [Candidatus Acidoferrales bacterium]